MSIGTVGPIKRLRSNSGASCFFGVGLQKSLHPVETKHTRQKYWKPCNFGTYVWFISPSTSPQPDREEKNLGKPKSLSPMFGASRTRVPAILEDPNVGHLFPTPSRNRPIWPSRDEFEVRWSPGLVEEQRMKNGFRLTKRDLTESLLRVFNVRSIPKSSLQIYKTLKALWGA